MNKRHLHHFWRKFRLLRPWYFLIFIVVFGTIHVFAMRANYTHMVALRTTVYAADEKNGDITKALSDLRAYVNAHMNTNLATKEGVYPPIQLKYTYDRLVVAEGERAKEQNSRIYTDAQKYCEQQYPNSFSGGPRAPCVAQYVSEHGIKVNKVPDALYKFDFVSPGWSPDLAGWSKLAAILSLIAAVVLFILDRWFKKHVT